MSAFRQSSFLGGEISPAMYGRTDLPKFPHAVRTLRNFLVKEEGSTTIRPGFKDLASTTSGAVARVFPFFFSRSYAYLLVFTNVEMKVYKNGVLQATVVSPFTAAQLTNIKHAQVGSKMWFTTAGVTQYALTWTSDTTWAFAAEDYTTNTAPPTNLVIGANTRTADDAHPAKDWQWAVTAVAAGEGARESLPVTSAVTNRVLYPDSAIQINWTAATGSPAYYNIYRGRNGKFGYVGSTPNTSYWDDGIYPVYSDPPPADRDPFSTGADYKPQVVSFFQQRVVYANATNDPTGWWTSVSGAFQDFNTASPPKDTDAISAALANMNFEEIRSIVALGANLLMLTNLAEWLITTDQGIFGPNTVGAVPLSYWGSGWADPVVFGKSVLFVSDAGDALRQMTLEEGASATEDLTVLARHMYDDGKTISRIAYQHYPFRTLWAVRSDGKLLTMGYSAQLQNFAWSLCDITGFTAEDVCVVPESGVDRVYLVGQYGGGRRILRMGEVNPATTTAADQLDLHVTAGAGGIVTGLDTLNGAAVYACVDGVKQGPFTVSGGSVTLTAPAITRAVVGLPINAELETLELRHSQQEIRTIEKNISKVSLEVYRGVSFSAGETLTDTLVPATLPAAGGNGFKSGLAEVRPASSWNAGGRVALRQTDPYPLTILSVIREVEYGTL